MTGSADCFHKLNKDRDLHKPRSLPIYRLNLAKIMKILIFFEKMLAFFKKMVYTITRCIGVWLSLVEYLNGVQVAAGSNPVTPTIPSVLIGLEPIRTFFFCVHTASAAY